MIEDREGLREIKDVIGFDVWREHLDVKTNKWWDKCSSLIKAYLIVRACDIVRFGKEVADLTFPQPDVNGATTKEVTEFVASLVAMVRHKEKYREWPNYVPRLVVPEHLDARVLSWEEARGVREACIRELRASDVQIQKVAGTIDEFAKFCGFLGKPENHILVPSGQYIEKQVNTRAELDMVGEATRLINSLPRYSAYAKIVEDTGEGARVWKGQVRMIKVEPVPADALEKTREAVEKNIWRYTKPREEIDEEIKKRQEKWRRRGRIEALSARGGEPEKPERAPERAAVEPMEEPPPPRRGLTARSREDESSSRETGKAHLKERLVYKSDFTRPTGWGEEHSDKVKVFRRNGYYRIAVYDGPRCAWFAPPIILDDFRAEVDAQLNTYSEEAGDYGIVFAERQENGVYFYYMFTVSPNGHFRLHNEKKCLIEWQRSDIIKGGDSPHTLMVERVGQKVTLGINGRIVATEMDSSLRPGHVGLFVRAYKDDLYAEAGFRNFVLYSIEK